MYILVRHASRHLNMTSQKTLAGISISPDGTENAKLYVCGLPDITVGPWQMEDMLDSDGCRRS